jgi:TolA-binding protein
MDTLQIQISELRNKVDSLYGLIERISHQVQGLSEAKEQKLERESYLRPSFESSRSISPLSGESKYQLTHKDVLVDDNSSTNTASSGSEQNLSPDIQIRRLTAQLTAAYNRIAALEEQLLTYRIHP